MFSIYFYVWFKVFLIFTNNVFYPFNTALSEIFVEYGLLSMQDIFISKDFLVKQVGMGMRLTISHKLRQGSCSFLIEAWQEVNIQTFNI